MIKRLIFTLYAILSVVFHIDAQTDYIVCGSISSKDTLANLLPDSALQCLTVHLSPYPSETDSFDLDHDGNYDVKFATFGNGGLGGGEGACYVAGLHSNVKIAIRKDTGYICCPQPVVMNVALPFSAGDTIHENLLYDGYGILMSNAYGGGSYTRPTLYPWNNIGQRFIGVRMELAFDTLYAWIAVEATGGTNYYSVFTLTIDQYGCNKNTHVDIAETSTSTRGIIFPNPTDNTVTIRFPTITATGYKISLYDLSGKLVFQDWSVNGQSEITYQLPSLSEGIYNLMISDESATQYYKLLITR